MGAAVVGGAEGDAVVVELHVAARVEREDLVAARVGEQVAVPVLEAVEPAHALDQLRAGLEHEVVRVAEDDLGAEVLQVGRRQRADRAAGAYGHEAGGADLAPGGRSEEHTSELQSLMRTSYAVFCLRK